MQKTNKACILWALGASVLSLAAQYAAVEYAFHNLFSGSTLADAFLLIALLPAGLLETIADTPGTVVLLSNMIFWGVVGGLACRVLSRSGTRVQRG